MKHYPISILVSVLIVVTIACVCEWLHYYKQTSSSTVAVSDESAAIDTLPSTMDLQRELNRRGYKLKVDGVCGPATQAAWDLECGNQYANELMLKEIE